MGLTRDEGARLIAAAVGLYEAIGTLDLAVSAVADPLERAALVQSVGWIIGELCAGVMDRVTDQFPELEPDPALRRV